jgi:hypothetical protein
MRKRTFLVSATIDFPDDCSRIVYTEELLSRLIGDLYAIGVRRIYWNFYQLDYWKQGFSSHQSASGQTLANLGDPLAVGCRLAHAQGMEFIAVIKPYENGMSSTRPHRDAEGQLRLGLPRIGGTVTFLDPWVMARPELRVRARAGDVPLGLERVPVQRIELRQKDMAPLRFGPENLEIWGSDDNCGFRKRDVAFAVSESVELCRRDVMDVLGNPVTRRGEPVRTLNLTGLNLLDPFIAVTTNLSCETGAFRNTAIEMIRAYGPGDQPLPIVVASHKAVWQRPRDFRAGDLEFDSGVGDVNVCLDVTNQGRVCPHCLEHGETDCIPQNPIFPDTPICRDGVIAFAKGRNAYVPASLCEAYPEVQDYWLSWVGQCLQAGVDGVDWRISNHSCWTNTPEIYGFNEPVLREYERRYGVNPDHAPYDPALVGALRGEFFDQFLQKVQRRLHAAGKRMHVHCEVESFRPDACQARWRTRPGNIHFNWQHWLQSGLPDEVTLMCVKYTPQQALSDPVGRELLGAARRAGVPVNLRHFIWTSRDGAVQAGRLEDAYRDDDVSGYNLYEAASFYDASALGPNGEFRYHAGLREAIRDKIRELSIY